MKKLILFFIAVFIFFTGCDKNPVGALVYSNTGLSEGWPSEWVLYDDILKTRGSPSPDTYTDYWNTRKSELSFEYRGERHSGSQSMRIKWDGSASRRYNPDGSLEPDAHPWFVGIGIKSADPLGGIFVPANTYTKLKFWVKGSLNYGVILKVEIPDAGAIYESSPGETFSDWREIECSIPHLNGIKYLISISLSLADGSGNALSNGGEIFIDDIRYVK
jgi:hypothetical protein